MALQFAIFAAAKADLDRRLLAIEAFGHLERCDVPRRSGRAALDGRPKLLRKRSQQPVWQRQSFLTQFGEQKVKTNNGYFDYRRSKEVVSLRDYLAKEASEPQRQAKKRRRTLKSRGVTWSSGPKMP